ncbi:MAG: ATP synthase F1 subunit delta [Alphaproteobacteria bacterium]|nr:ATP synthase F1 subunit delta [Alphaproteobacteria bacterium]
MQRISKYKTALVYARAWLDAAIDDKKDDFIMEEVRLLKDSLNRDADKWTLLATPQNDNKDILIFVDDFAKRVGFSNVTTETLKLIALNRRFDILELIIEDFIHLYYQHKRIVEVHVDTVIALSVQQEKLLQDILEKKLKSSVLIHYHLRPEVLGGLAVRFGSFLIDDTLANKINHINQLMLNHAG